MMSPVQILMLVALLCWAWVGHALMVLVNLTDSLEPTLFLLHAGEMPRERGQFLAFYPTEVCETPDGHKPYLKQVVGLPGDKVAHHNQAVWINGERLGPVQSERPDGRPLNPGPAGPIPDNHVFVAGTHENSHDSRYASIGWVALDHCVLGRADVVL